MNRVICIISTEFFTHWGGSFRQERWCDFFLNRGYSVNIIHCEPTGKVIQHLFTSSKDLKKKKAEYLMVAVPKAGVKSGRLAFYFRFLKHTFLLDVLSPLNLKLYYNIRKCISKLEYENVVLHCSSPSFYLALISAFLKVEFKSKLYFWVDMRDLWSLHVGIPGPKFHKRFIERIVLGKADLVTTVADSLSARFNKSFNINVDVAYNVATHISFDNLESSKRVLFTVAPQLSPNKITITYTGSLPSGYYDMDLFADWIKKLNKCASIFHNYQFLFIGECYELKNRVKQLDNLTVLFLNQQSHEVIKNLQFNSDILLFFGFKSFDNQGQMSIKLFEYFETRNSILTLFVNENSDIHKIIDLYCGMSLSIFNYEVLHDVLIKYLADRDSLPRMENSVGREYLLGSYENIVDKIEANFFKPDIYG